MSADPSPITYLSAASVQQTEMLRHVRRRSARPPSSGCTTHFEEQRASSESAAGQPPAPPDVLAFMTAQGFHLLDICSQLRRDDGALIQADNYS